MFGDKNKVQTYIAIERECKHKVNGTCFNNRCCKKLGKTCISKCEEFEEDNKLYLEDERF